MFATLKALIKLRNTLTHQKIHLRDGDGMTVSKGNNAGGISMEPKDRIQLQRFIMLPYALQAHMVSQTNDQNLINFLNSILKDNQNKLKSGEAILKSVR